MGMSPSEVGRRQPLSAVALTHSYFSRRSSRSAVPTSVFEHLSLDVGPGEIVSVVGPSGCGKSTLLSILAGILVPAQGRVRLGDRDITGQPGHLGYVMQVDQLLPWRTALDNVALGQEIRGDSRRDTLLRARALMQRFALGGFEHHYPHALSGGMRQRVGFLRTVLCDWQVLLLDEPFRGVDALTKSHLHEWLLTLCGEFGLSVLLVTHDPDEAVFLSDRVLVLSDRPAAIIGEVTVELSRPRSYEVIASPAFAVLKHHVLALLWQSERAASEAEVEAIRMQW